MGIDVQRLKLAVLGERAALKAPGGAMCQPAIGGLSNRGRCPIGNVMALGDRDFGAGRKGVGRLLGGERLQPPDALAVAVIADPGGFLFAPRGGPLALADAHSSGAPSRFRSRPIIPFCLAINALCLVTISTS